VLKVLILEGIIRPTTVHDDCGCGQDGGLNDSHKGVLISPFNIPEKTFV
jgi:hypothetical protein